MGKKSIFKMAHGSAQQQSLVFPEAPAKVQTVICKLNADQGRRGWEQQGAVPGGRGSWTQGASYRY